MKKILKYYFLASVLPIFYLCGSQLSLTWMDKIDQAKILAKEQKKPLLILFSDEKHCVWCQKLRREIFDDQDFISMTKNKYIFFHADLSQQIIAKEIQELEEAYQIDGIPSLVMVDYSGEHISTMGYLPVSGKKYAKTLRKIVEDYKQVSMHLKNNSQVESQELMDFILKAKEMKSLYFRSQLLKRNIKKENYCLLLLEKYRVLLKNSQNHIKQLNGIKKQIDKIDPNNYTKAHRQLALLDFLALAKKTPDDKIDEIVKPLIHYINEFGKSDQENLWKVQMMVSQYYFAKKKWYKALVFARDSYKSAPICIRKDLVETIRYLKKKVNSPTH